MKFGRILHLDGNMLYFKNVVHCIKLNLTVDAYCIKECHQPLFISELLSLHHPDILILTGHDSMTKEKRYSMTPSDYKNSRFLLNRLRRHGRSIKIMMILLYLLEGVNRITKL